MSVPTHCATCGMHLYTNPPVKDIKCDKCEENELLTILCQKQQKLLTFINKIMYDSAKEQRSLPEEEQDRKLLYLAWSTNDLIADNPEQETLRKRLKEEFGKEI